MLKVSKALRQKLNREHYGAAVEIDKNLVRYYGKNYASHGFTIKEVTPRYVLCDLKGMTDVRINYRSKHDAKGKKLREDWSTIEPPEKLPPLRKPLLVPNDKTWSWT